MATSFHTAQGRGFTAGHLIYDSVQKRPVIPWGLLVTERKQSNVIPWESGGRWGADVLLVARDPKSMQAVGTELQPGSSVAVQVCVVGTTPSRWMVHALTVYSPAGAWRVTSEWLSVTTLAFFFPTRFLVPGLFSTVIFFSQGLTTDSD